MRKVIVFVLLALCVAGCSKSGGGTASNDSHPQGLAALGH